MSLQVCTRCGIGFDLDHVPKNPFKVCPNPACRAPLDGDAVEHSFVEASNPSDVNDAQRKAGKEQLTADVALHSGDTKASKASKAGK